MRPPSLLFSKIVLAIQDPLRLHMNFSMDFSISEKKQCQDFDSDYIDPCDFK